MYMEASQLISDLLGRNHRAQMVYFRISPGQILQIELGKSVMRLPVTGCQNQI